MAQPSPRDTAPRVAAPGRRPARDRPLPAWPPPPGEAFFEEFRALMLDPSQGETGPRALAPRKQKRLFEQEFAALCGRRHCIAVNSGTTALDLAVEALALPAGGVVVAADYGHPSTLRFAAQRHRLRLIDVDPETLCCRADALAAALEDGEARAVFVTHFAGLSGDIEAIARLCDESGVPLIEDASHAHGASFRGRPAGGFGRIACFSLHATKNLAAGEGGVLCLDDEELFRRAWRLHDIGRDPDASPYQFEALGGNFRMSEVNALQARHQLLGLEAQLSRRRAAADRLLDAFGEDGPLVPLRPHEGDLPGWHILAAWYRPDRLGGLSRKRFILSMCAEGIPCNGGWPHPMSAIEPFRPFAEPGSAPTAARACEEMVWFDARILLADEGVEQLLQALEKMQTLGASRHR